MNSVCSLLDDVSLCTMYAYPINTYFTSTKEKNHNQSITNKSDALFIPVVRGGAGPFIYTLFRTLSFDSDLFVMI